MWTDQASGVLDRRVQLEAVLGQLRPGGYAGGVAAGPAGPVVAAPDRGGDGRFTQQDTHTLTLTHLADPTQANRYAYAGDDPINNTDPTGASLGSDICNTAVSAVGTGIAVAGIVTLAPEASVAAVGLVAFGYTASATGLAVSVGCDISSDC